MLVWAPEAKAEPEHGLGTGPWRHVEQAGDLPLLHPRSTQIAGAPGAPVVVSGKAPALAKPILAGRCFGVVRGDPDAGIGSPGATRATLTNRRLE